MSVVLLEEYKTLKSKKDRREVLAERTRILEMVSRKAQEKTLTLQETTDLYAKFNSTYDQKDGVKSQRKDDESWALKLIQECEEEVAKTSSLETRINGIPLVTHSVTTSKPKPNLSQIRAISQHGLSDDDPIFVDDKPKLKDAFVYPQFSLNEFSSIPQPARKSQRSLITVLAICGVITVAALIGNALFL